MKKLLFITAVFIFTISCYADSIYFSPSFYYTRGDYSNNSYSNSYAGYLAISNLRNTLLLSYDNLTIGGGDNKYIHHYFNAGGILGFTNFYLKLNYGHAEGSYNQNTTGRGNMFNNNNTNSSTNDVNNLYSIDAFYTDYSTYLGVGYSFQKQEGNVSRDVYQILLRLEYIPHWRILFSLKPVWTYVSDGRELFGLNGRINYLPFDRFLIKAHGFYGERAYFFDPDLLILFNQDETQKYLAALQLEYYFTYNFNIAAGFQHTSFGSYKINYYILGVRTNLVF